MTPAADEDDVLSWIPAPALLVRDQTIAALNDAASALLGPAERALEAFAARDRAVLLAAKGERSVLRLGSSPPHRFVEASFGPHPEGGVIALLTEVTERERLDAVIAEFATGVYITDAELEAMWIPDRVSQAVGLPRNRFVGSDVYERLHPDDREPTRELVAQARAMPGVRCSRPMRVRQFDQPDVWWPIVTHVIWRGDDPAIGGLLVRFDMDLTASVLDRDTEETAQSLVTLGSSSTTGALHLSLAGTLLQRSTRVREILRPVADDADLHWLELLGAEDRAHVVERLDAAKVGTLLPAIEVAFAGDGTVVWARVDVLPYRDTQGRVAGMFVNVADLSAERDERDALSAAREELWHLANHDPLTGLANRYQLAERLDAALEGASRPAVIVADLDRFKEVNDRHGHRVGDRVLAEAARRIARAVGTHDLVCRFGGDEFVVLREHVDDPSQLDELARRLGDGFARPIEVDEWSFNIGISVGGALVEADGADTPDSLILRADRAMYAAKAERRAAG